MTIFNKGISAIYSDINFAFRWIAHDATEEIKAFYDMNHAINYSEFKEALKSYQCPSQNFVYADIRGNIAMHHNGKLPIRCEQYKKYILPGNSSDFIWKGFIPFNELPSIKNPNRGFVSSANQHPIPDGVDYYYLPGVYWPSHRAHRINQMLELGVKNNDVDIDYMKKIQNDNFNNYAFDILPLLLSIVNTFETNNPLFIDIYDSLDKWKENPVHNADMYEPIIFDAWYKELSEAVWGDLFLDDDNNQKYHNHVYPLYDRLLKIIKDHPSEQSKWFDDIRTEQKEKFEDVVWESFKIAINKLNTHNSGKYIDWKYSDYRGTDIHHMIPSPQFDVFSRLDIPTSGSRWAPNAMQQHFGPSWRYIVEMENGNIQAFGIYPGGQSGDPADQYYDNYIDKWNEGEYLDLNFTYYNNQNSLQGNKVVFSSE